jgi:hypothetical protein
MKTKSEVIEAVESLIWCAKSKSKLYGQQALKAKRRYEPPNTDRWQFEIWMSSKTAARLWGQVARDLRRELI